MAGRYILDIEANDLLIDRATNAPHDKLKTIHCIVLRDIAVEEEPRVFFDSILKIHQPAGAEREGGILAGLAAIENADYIVGHNIQGYDFPALKSIYPHFQIPEMGTYYDTLVAARLMFPHIKDGDFALFRRKILPGQMIGRHSLEAWGYRVGALKGEYAKKEDAWDKISKEMVEYCMQDTLVNLEVYRYLNRQRWPKKSMLIEHQFAKVLDKQMHRGMEFDMKAAEELEGTLVGKLAEANETLGKAFKPFVDSYPVNLNSSTQVARALEEQYLLTPEHFTKTGKPSITKSIKKRLAVSLDIPFEDGNFTEFSFRSLVDKRDVQLGSRDQVGQALVEQYGWKPFEYNKNGAPKLDADTIDMLNPAQIPMIQEIKDYYNLVDVLGGLSNGKQALIPNAVSLGKGRYRIHGGINHNGARTGRCTHRVVANIPRVSSRWGEELRSLFTARPGYGLVGADVAGVEARLIAHYLAPFDDGKLIRRTAAGDIHTDTWKMCQPYIKSRNDAKGSWFAVMFGAKGGRIAAMNNLPPNQGNMVRQLLLDAVPGLEQLINKVLEKWHERGFLVGLDGRKLYPRKEGAVFNALIQAGGAIVMKKAVVDLEVTLEAAGIIEDEDYGQVLAYHDETANECKPEVAAIVETHMNNAIISAGEFWNLRLPLDSDSKQGNSWAQIH